MKYLWLSLLAFTFIFSVQSQNITGFWTQDWQNKIYTGCYPYAIDIYSYSTSYFATYYFNNEVVFGICLFSPDKISGDTTVNIYQQETNVWSGAYGSQFTYDPATGTISSQFPDSTGPLLIFTLNNTASEQLALGTLSASWVSPVSTNSSQPACCVPDSIFVALMNPQATQIGQFNAYYNYSQNGCASNTTFNFQLVKPNPIKLNWQGSNTQQANTPQHQIFFSPHVSTESLILTFNDSDQVCSYTYERLTPSRAFSGQWLPDWQSTLDGYSPIDYTTVYHSGSNYMTSYIHQSNNDQSNNVSITSFLVQTPQGTYFDPYLGLNGTTFTYYSNRGSLLSVSSAPFTQDSLLLSSTGSLFSPEPFISFWGVATAPNGGSAPSSCCVPEYINITNTTRQNNTLGVAYTFSNGSIGSSMCNYLSPNIYNGQIASELYIQTPNATQLTWTDLYLGHKITLQSTSGIESILVTDFNDQCSFVMTMTTPPPPVPMFGSFLSFRVFLFVIVAFMSMALI